MTVGNLEFEAAQGPEGEVFLTVRPEEVAVAAAALDGDGQPNCVRGWIVRVVDKGALIRIDIDVGVVLVALMGRRGFQSTGLGVGDEVSAFFEPSATHVFAPQ